MTRIINGYQVKLDSEDEHFLNEYRWVPVVTGRSKTTYLRSCVRRGVYIYFHRIVIIPEKGKDIDHIDGNGLNNIKSNLRICTHAQNLFNRGKNKNNTSGFKGVVWYPRTSKWKAQIMYQRKMFHIGLFSTPEEASEAYKNRAIQLFGEFAKW
jgi:hypothetical protein